MSDHHPKFSNRSRHMKRLVGFGSGLGMLRTSMTAVCFSCLLLACGGGQGTDVAGNDAATQSAVGISSAAIEETTTSPVIPPIVTLTAQDDSNRSVELVPSLRSAPDTSSQRLSAASLAMPAAALAAVLAPVPVPDPGLLLLLLPDEGNAADPGVAAWMDAASEVGVRIHPVSDSQFLALGATAQGYAGLILPDNLHTTATDALLAAVIAYTQSGGRTMLVYDFGALTLANGEPVYPIPKSRLSSLAGVDYVLYDALGDQTTGLGPVTALRSTMRSLLVPPGKSLPFTGLSSPLTTGASVAAAKVANTSSKLATQSNPLLSAANITAQSSLYLPVSVADPGGVRGFDPQQYSSMPYASSKSRKGVPRSVKFNLGRAIKGKSPLKPSLMRMTPVAASSQASALPSATPKALALAADPLDAYHGYLLGNLIYPTYVTQGDFGGLPGQKVVATSPQFGLVAGVNPVGAGKVLFVNLPMTYLKGHTDALMMHGFLHYFTREVLDMAHLSTMPNGVAGMTLDWHLDSNAAQQPTTNLINSNVFNDPKALFSIDMTAGPDAIVAQDALGWNLPVNATAQQFLKTFQAAGHSVGAHGGWIHDFYGGNTTETNTLLSTGGACLNTATNVDNFLECLVLNRQAVDGVTGKPSRSYSAPEGNNPPWAMDWLESQGVVATYFGGHTGLGATRQYREGQLLNPSIWVFPVTPQGLYATYEEFQDYNVPQAEVTGWYHDLMDFSVAQNTSRMVYAHPPGADEWRSVLLEMLTYAKNKGPQFAWYTMPRLADFMTRRLAVKWSQRLNATNGRTIFTVSHPSGLREMVWRLPKSRYITKPVITSGVATVDGSNALYWQVKAGAGTTLVFRS